MNTNARVAAVALDDTTVFVAGAFTRIGDERRQYVASLDRATGRVLAFHVDLEHPASTVAVLGDVILLGGTFSRAYERVGSLVCVSREGVVRRSGFRTTGAVKAIALSSRFAIAFGSFSTEEGPLAKTSLTHAYLDADALARSLRSTTRGGLLSTCGGM